MKRALATLMLTMLPALASAQPGPGLGLGAGGPAVDGPMIHPVAPTTALTGKVSVLQPRCFRAPCHAIVRIETENGYVSVQGDYKADLKAFDGRVVTVQGKLNGSSIDASAFATGKSAGFVTGVVEDRRRCTRSIPAVCTGSVVIKTLEGEEIQVNDPATADKLALLNGATVSVKGDVRRIKCPPNARCFVMDGSYLTVAKDANILVKGTLSPLRHIMIARPGQEWGTHYLEFPNGGKLAVYGGKKAWSDRMDTNVWVSGKLDGNKFRATNASKTVYPDRVIEPFPFPVPMADGSNVLRTADTEGGVSTAPSASGATGAGMARD